MVKYDLYKTDSGGYVLKRTTGGFFNKQEKFLAEFGIWFTKAKNHYEDYCVACNAKEMLSRINDAMTEDFFVNKTKIGTFDKLLQVAEILKNEQQTGEF